MKFFSAAYWCLMYGFLAYLWLLFISEIIERTQSFNSSFLTGAVILTGTVLFWTLAHHITASAENKHANRIAGSASFCLVILIHFYVIPLC
ncbi:MULTISPECIES: hypothetical protein [Bacillus]|uniref:Uncharacterized protein n=1 Tax=Bacillus glycinifermentans TaxID=1664069 RepID=A0AAJ3Z032_9BACI|nr:MULTISPECIES: hypothetical protein [Bacillus]KKB72421.1 hypothetical protein TH62_16405 [Bacillus sp. TH008]MBU8787058.1 hypothetical protein [Bacillus glycinifermentans]MDU0070118.1 hypothetical protein [Bacillus sp. IG6]MED8017791.1 hypothetical protein [Bacillus glycinifermentans]NUJ16235.1 hypothetical protein [Bacillus glycinifermentans]